MASSNFTAFNASLPTKATEQLNRIDRDNPNATQNLPSYFNSKITNGGLLTDFMILGVFEPTLLSPVETLLVQRLKLMFILAMVLFLMVYFS